MKPEARVFEITSPRQKISRNYHFIWGVECKPVTYLVLAGVWYERDQASRFVYDRTANAKLYLVTKFPFICRLLFIIYNCTKIGRFTPILSIRIFLITVFVCSFLILKISQLKSHVCRKHSSISLDFLKVLYYFFPGWLCHFKGLFIPVWREIHRSKMLPLTSWQLTNRSFSLSRNKKKINWKQSGGRSQENEVL